MKREEQIRSIAFMASMTEETIVREEVVKGGVHVGYKDIKLRDSDRPIARLFFRKGVSWADENPKSPWISVEERLPVEDEVLVLNEYGGTTVAFYNHQYKEWNLAVGEIEGSGTIHSKITHWMPIPELPKEERV